MNQLLACNSWLEYLPSYSMLRNENRKKSLFVKGRKIFDYGIGDPREKPPAFVLQALTKAAEAAHGYPAALGSMELREACASWLQRRFNVQLNPANQIVSSNGSKEAIFHIAHALINSASRRRMIVFPDPGYPVYENSVILSGGIPYRIPLNPADDFQFDPDQIPPSLLDQIAAVWVNSPHNPSGAVMTRERMEKIYAWAVRHGIVLLSDECYVDVFFPGTTPPASFLEIAAKNQYRNLLSFFTLSKRSGMTGYRTGFVAGDSALMGAYAKYRPHAGVGTPDFVQAAATAAWNEDSHVGERNSIFAKKHALVADFLKKNSFRFLESSATFYLWVQVPDSFASQEGLSRAEEYAQRVAEATGIIVTPGDALGRSSDNWFRLALVPTESDIVESLSLWQQFCEGANGGG